MVTFISVAIVMTLIAVALIVTPLFRNAATRAPVASLLAALIVPAVTAVMYTSISSYPWGPAAPAGDGIEHAAAAEIAELERQVGEQPQQLAGWLALAERYMAAERFANARDAYGRALQVEPQNSAARLGSAEAAIMLDRDALAGEAGREIEEVLAAEPDNAKALWYSGMAALSRGASDVVRERWQRLLALSPPRQVREIIEEQLAQLQPPAAAPGQAGTAGARIEVRVSIAPALADRVRPGAPVFLIARDPDRPGPPVAVVRADAGSLPSALAITDDDVMMPGQSLSSLSRVNLTARVANAGDAQATSGDVFGEMTWTRTAGKAEITIDRIVP